MKEYPEYTVDDVIKGLYQSRHLPASGGPSVEKLQYIYDPSKEHSRVRVGLLVPSMATHMSNEGHEIFKGLEYARYHLSGYKVGVGTDVSEVVQHYYPSTLVIQDRREYEGRTAGPGFDIRERFTNVNILRDRSDIFKVTIVKDAQHNPQYHREAAEEIGCHAWIVYYHPRIVSNLAPYLRKEHLVRTYHTVDKSIVPVYSPQNRKDKALLSGAISPAYPLRSRLHKQQLANLDYRMHPGYGRKRCDTPNYLQALSHYKVAICTASRFGYLLRKVIEATSCGCRVITDLPKDEVVPYIDGNLIRVHPSITVNDIFGLVRESCNEYSPELQEEYAKITIEHYDYRVEGKRLADAIEDMRVSYNV